jgi:2'-5' RNA ligase
MRIFVAILLDNNIKSHIKDMSDKLSRYFEKARFTRTENYHITVKFIGETDRKGFEKTVSAVKNIAPEVGKFAIKTSGPGSFKRRNQRSCKNCMMFYARNSQQRELRRELSGFRHILQ